MNLDILSLVNVAINKPATQSTLSRWSTGPNEASNAVSGSISRAFAFHTEEEDQPWWEVDLISNYPIERIVVHNRLDTLSERARTLKVEVSTNHSDWLLVHAGVAYFSGAERGNPLDLRLESEICARFVRLSLTERQPLHLAQVEVLVRPDILSIIIFREQHNLSSLTTKVETPCKSPYRIYHIKSSGFSSTMPIIGLAFTYAGRLGNMLLQYTNAILLAERTGLRYIQLGRHELSDPQAPVSVAGLTFLPSNADLPPCGAFLTGDFFNSSDFVPVLSQFLSFGSSEEIEYCRVVREIIRPHLLTGLSSCPAGHVEDELTIHLRSGDIFGPEQTDASGYIQPPLAFYIVVVNKLVASGTITRVRLVFEDRGNPCVDALEEFLAANAIAFRCQSGTLAEDLSALVDAPHLVFGYGTFGYAVCRLSSHIKTLHYFAPELGGCYALIPGIDQVFSVRDREGAYIKEWNNTPEQRQTMRTYPSEALEIQELSPPRTLSFGSRV